MSAARDHILARLRPLMTDQRLAEERLRARRRASPPKLPNTNLARLFAEKAQASNAAVLETEQLDFVPRAVRSYLESNRLPLWAKRAADPVLGLVPWLSDPALSVTVGAADPADPCAITIAKAAIAETGTLVLVSEPTTPYLMNFLPETLVVVVPASRIVALLEDAFDLVRAGPANITRNFTLVTGPSRTADIEQTLEIGAHGPKRELIVIVHDPRQL